MIPYFVKKLALTTAVTTVLVAMFWARVDWKAAAMYFTASAWMTLNLFIWTGLVLSAIKVGPRKARWVWTFALLKVAALGGGFAALVVCAPYSTSQGIGLVVGIATLLMVAALKAAGARITGRDLFAPTPHAPKVKTQNVEGHV